MLTLSNPMYCARIVGVSWLITIAASYYEGFAIAAGPLAAPGTYRSGIVAGIVAGIAYAVVTLLLYVLLKRVSRRLSLVAAGFGLVGIAIGALSELGHIAPLMLLSGAHYLRAFDNAQLHAMADFSTKLHWQVFSLSFLFSGVQCMLLGWLIFRSTFLPKTIGVLMAVAGLSLLSDGLATIISPNFENTLSTVALPLDLLGEGALALWLLIVGVNAAKWEQQNRVSK